MTAQRFEGAAEIIPVFQQGEACRMQCFLGFKQANVQSMAAQELQEGYDPFCDAIR